MRVVSRGGWKPFALVWCVVACVCLLRNRPASSVERFDGCLAELGSVATALEMYSTEHGGHYPQALDALVPGYLPTLPYCPSAGIDTYSVGYQVGPEAPFNEGRCQDFYYLCCTGNHHPDAIPNTPRLPAFGLGCVWRDQARYRRAHGYLGDS